MKILYVEGVANHDDSESCMVSREGAIEALTGAHAGRVFSREIEPERSADGLWGHGRQYDSCAPTQAHERLRAAKDPWHVWNLSAWEPGDHRVVRRLADRVGKAGRP